MVDIPDSVPAELRAGDTVRFNREHADYPASAGWTLSYTLVTGTAAYSFNATANGNAFSITVAAATTAPWTVGLYQLHEYVTKAAERYTLGTTPLRVLPNLAAVAAGGLDVRSHARKVLDAINAWLEAKAPTAAGFELAGRKLQNYALPELLALRDRYRAEVAREEQVASGRPPSRLLTRL